MTASIDTQAVPEAPAAAAPEAVDAPADELSQLGHQVVARAAASSGGLVGGVGMRARDLAVLQQALESHGDAVAAVVRQRLREALAAAKIAYGVDEELVEQAVRDFVDHVRAGDPRPVTRKVAAGEAPEPGEDGRVEYILNHRGRPFAELAGLDRRSPRTLAHVVNTGDALARLLPPRAPKPGTSVTGETLKDGHVPDAASLDGVVGDNTEVDGAIVRAACDGLCVEDASGWLRVIPEIVLDNVDATTGRVPESGISGSNIAVRRSVKGDYGVATAENLFVGEGRDGGTIDGLAPVQARNVVVNGTLSGASDREAPVEAAEYCVVREVVSRRVSARHVLIADSCHLGRLEAEQSVWVDGGVRGGVIVCPGSIVVKGDLGTVDGGSNTVIRFSAGSAQARRQRRIAAARQRLLAEQEEAQAAVDALAEESDNRAKADAYWAKLVDGEAPPPKGVLQVKAQQIFTELGEKRQRAERRLAAASRAVQRLSSGDDDDEDGDEETRTATLVAGGTVYLDVAFELAAELTADDGETEVNFSHDGQRFRNHNMNDVKRLLTEKVSAYLERQNASVAERKAAIEQMFQGQESKPSAPQVEEKSFDIDLRWAHVDGPDDLEVTAVARVSSREPGTIHVINRARLRQPRAGVVVTVVTEGSRATFGVADVDAKPGGWRADPEVTEQLDGVCAAGVNAMQLIRGEGLFVARTAPAGEQEEGTR